MADRYATKAGNWSDPTVWDGGTLPVAGDVARPNNFTVTIDQDVTVATLTNNAAAPAAANGIFTVASVPADGRTITADVVAAASAGLLTVSYSGSNLLTVNGVITGGGVNAVGMAVTGAANIVVNGNMAGGGTNSWGANITGAATLTVNGNVTTTGSSAGVHSGAAITLTVNGAVTSAGSVAGINLLTSAAVADINGSLTAGTSAPALRSTSATAVVRAKGPFIHAVNGRAPIIALWFTVYPGQNTRWVGGDDSAFHGAAADVTLQVWNDESPSPSDVRSGVVYGIDHNLVGTAVIPPPATVAAGVPVGATVGTAVLAIDSGVATVASTGAQLAAVLDV